MDKTSNKIQDSSPSPLERGPGGEVKKVVLAFSGGLDTSYCAIYLSKDLGYEVHTLTVNTGGFSPEELIQIEKRALTLGVKSHKAVKKTQTYYNKEILSLTHATCPLNRP